MRIIFLLLFIPHLNILANEHKWSLADSFRQPHEITFSKSIPSTTYTFLKDTKTLNINVKKSASAVILPFDKVTRLGTLTIIWRLNSGERQNTSAAKEKTRLGDDFILRVGFMLHGAKRWVPFFAPGWVKLIDSFTKFGSQKMIYHIPMAATSSGSKWLSPYSDSIENIVMTTTKLAPNKFQSTYTHKLLQPTIGLWIMSDGDNTASSFDLTIHDLTIN